MFEELAVSPVAAEKFHNLEAIAGEVHREYFGDHPRLAIRWGKNVQRRKRRSIRLGSYHPATRLVRIHSLLDSPNVPTFFLQSIVFHEYLHHVLGPDHDVSFHRYERGFRFHRESKEWLRKNLPVLLGRRKKTRNVMVPPPPPLIIPNRPAIFQLQLF